MIFQKHNSIYCSVRALQKQLLAYCFPLIRVWPTRLCPRHRRAGGWPWARSSRRREVGVAPSGCPLWFPECALSPPPLCFELPLFIPSADSRQKNCLDVAARVAGTCNKACRVRALPANGGSGVATTYCAMTILRFPPSRLRSHSCVQLVILPLWPYTDHHLKSLTHHPPSPAPLLHHFPHT